jgi:hypothetical protein
MTNPPRGSSCVPGTTDEGFLALLNGEVDIALSLREPNAVERLAARDQAPEDPPLTRRVRVLALDALVPVVSRDNPVSALAHVGPCAAVLGRDRQLGRAWRPGRAGRPPSAGIRVWARRRTLRTGF